MIVSEVEAQIAIAQSGVRSINAQLVGSSNRGHIDNIGTEDWGTWVEIVVLQRVSRCHNPLNCSRTGAIPLFLQEVVGVVSKR